MREKASSSLALLIEPVMSKDALVHEIGVMLLSDDGIQSRNPWHHLVMVAQIMSGSTKVNGFAYKEDGKVVPTSPDNFDILKKFRELQQAMAEPNPNKELWKAALVRIDYATKDISIEFEYDNPEKWLISPASVKQMAETLRPKR